jgi:hypothetical protein
LDLLPKQREEVGYGSYTYFLLGRASRDANERRETAIKSFLDGVRQLEKVARYYGQKSINICYLPVESPITENLMPRLVLDRYDYTHSRLLLGFVSQVLRNGDGPYIISSRQPLSQTSGDVGLLDLSRIPPSLISPWLSEYLGQLEQGMLLDKPFEPSIVLRMRTVLEVLGKGIPEVAQSISDWVKVVASSSQVSGRR